MKIYIEIVFRQSWGTPLEGQSVLIKVTPSDWRIENHIARVSSFHLQECEIF